MIRLQDWPARLDAYLSSVAIRPFEWGKHDCVLMALDAAGAQLGFDPAHDIRGKYSTAIGAARRMKDLYGSSRLDQAAKAFAEKWGGLEITPPFARRGDVLMFKTPEGPALGVCSGRNICAAGSNGTITLPLSAAVAGWRV
jgi:hypothetical protein